MTADSYLNLTQAVEFTGVSRPTLIKYLRAGKMPNATQQSQGKVLVWQIPLTDLQPYLDKASSPQTAPKSPQKRPQPLTEEQELRVRVRELETEVSGLRELLAEVRNTNAILTAVIPQQIETREAQQRRRWGWLRP
jgi:hypothetical protein